MSADSRLCTLSHFEFYCCTCVEISLMYAKTTGRNLNDGVFAETVKILMESAFSRVVANAEKFRRLCKALVSIVADLTVAHCRKHYRHCQFKLGRKLCIKRAVGVPFDFRRLFAEKHLCFHRLTQWIYRGIGDLRSID